MAYGALALIVLLMVSGSGRYEHVQHAIDHTVKAEVEGAHPVREWHGTYQSGYASGGRVVITTELAPSEEGVAVSYHVWIPVARGDEQISIHAITGEKSMIRSGLNLSGRRLVHRIGGRDDVIDVDISGWLTVTIEIWAKRARLTLLGLGGGRIVREYKVKQTYAITASSLSVEFGSDYKWSGSPGLVYSSPTIWRLGE